MYDITYMWNLKNNTNEFIYKIDSQTQKTNLWLPKGKAVGGGISSVAKSCLTLCDPWTAAGQASLSHYLPEFAQTLIHLLKLSGTIQPSHPLSPPSLAFSLSQH